MGGGVLGLDGQDTFKQIPEGSLAFFSFLAWCFNFYVGLFFFLSVSFSYLFPLFSNGGFVGDNLILQSFGENRDSDSSGCFS